LSLGLGEAGEEWEFQQIGTAAEKSNVEKELADLRERLSKVDAWKQRRADIEAELSKVWVEGGDELDEPDYIKARQEKQQEEGDEEEGLEMMGSGRSNRAQISADPASPLGASQETVLSSAGSDD
jgi:ATP-binding cassette subfamily D (ALD) long-chain fatty acid import protein